jgi:acyl phosphate:glycerol-3-phosphate acyltransferase
MAVVVAVSYAIGSVPFALLLARRFGSADLRHVGSGNLGAANVVRASGVVAGVLVALLDASKGALSVALAPALSHAPGAPAVAGLAAIVGHVYPVWLKFRGGKGVATACGVFAVLAPVAVVPALTIFAITVSLTKYISLGSVLASLALPPLAFAAGSSMPVLLVAVAAAGLIVFRHRSNLRRLKTGNETRFSRNVRRRDPRADVRGSQTADRI